MAPRYSEIIQALGCQRVKRDEPLADHTTFKIGGPADYFYEAKTSRELVKAVKLAKKLKVPYCLLAGGSKTLVADQGFAGLVIKVASSGTKISGRKVVVEAGAVLTTVLEAVAQAGLSGLEFLAGIPGTVGGAVVGNAGAWQQAIGEKILRVQILDKKNQVQWLDQKNCSFAYRQSRFKKSQEVVLAIELCLAKGKPATIKKKMQTFLSKRQNQPQEPSVGSIFVNPKPLAAAFLIEDCGLKGKKSGDAQISPEHANFIVNLGQAKARQVLCLIKLAQKEVRKKFGVVLKKEVRLVGFAKMENDG